MDVVMYAQIMAELASGRGAREEILTRHGLDEPTWNAVDADLQARLSASLDGGDEAVPPLLTAYLGAYEHAQRSLATPISLERFAEVTRLLQASGDLRAALSRVGIGLADYVQASEHWSRRIAEDPEIERRFEEASGGGRGS